MRLGALALLVVGLVVAAGCLGLGDPETGSDVDEGPGEPSPANVTASPFGSVAADNAFEPTATAGPDGTVYVTSANSDLVHVRPNGSDGWESRAAPPPPPESGTAKGGDRLVATDADGRLWYTALLAGRTSAGDLPAAGGVQIAVSEDGGQTWAANHYIGPPEFPWDADRQWITFAPDGTVHVVWKAYRGGDGPRDEHLVAVTLPEDGSSVSAPVSVTPTVPPRSNLVGGRPSVTSDGTLLVPYLRQDFSNATSGNGTLRVSQSTDGGDSFEQIEAWDPPGGDPGTWFPVSAVDGRDRFHVVWTGPENDTLHARSADGRSNWTDATAVHGLSEHGVTSPWIEVEEGTARVAAFRTPRDDRVPLDVTAFPANATPSANVSSTARIAEPPRNAGFGGPAFTDFAHLSTLPSGDNLAVWGVAQNVGGEIEMATVNVSRG